MYVEDRHPDIVDFICDAYKDDLSLEGGLMVKECAALYAARSRHSQRSAV
jgi:tRNA(adenine34) deaminase